MAEIGTFIPQKLVIGILLSEKSLETSLMERLKEEFGEIDFLSDWLDFSITRYYDKEMGAGIEKRFISFRSLIDPQKLPEIKIKTNEIEDSFRNAGMRPVNLDPGILSQSRFILATTKDGSHRIPLRDGIYGEVTLQYSQKDFRDQDWTYPDYRSEKYKAILREIRTILTSQLDSKQK